MKLIKKIKAKGLPDFLKKTLVFITILFILDFTIGTGLKYLYFKQDSGLLYRTTYSLDSTKADFLIFGSSTANHHYDPAVIAKRMNMSVYNTGRDANTIFYNYAVFQSILKRYTPKIAILDFNVGEARVFPRDYDRLSSLLPYYQNHPELRSIIELKSPFEKLKLISGIYPYNSLLFTILVGNMDYNKSRDHVNDENGFVPLYRAWHRKLKTDNSPKNYQLDSTKISILESFVRECKRTNIQLYICISPRFKKYLGKDPSVEVVKNIANEYQVPFYNFSRDTLFWNHPEYFADEMHLNIIGASVFSNDVTDKIKQSQKQGTKTSKENFPVQIKEN